MFNKCETFLTPTIDDTIVFKLMVIFFRKDRLHKRGGGILMYISQRYKLSN